MAGKLAGIARASVLKAPLETLDAAEITVAGGIDGDARGSKPGRQVTVIAREAWEAACRDVGADLDWTTRRANLLTEDIELPRRAGARLRIGAALFEVTEETAPCMLMERAHTGLRKALAPDWRGGVCCTVVDGGAVALGDTVSVEDR